MNRIERAAARITQEPTTVSGRFLGKVIAETTGIYAAAHVIDNPFRFSHRGVTALPSMVGEIFFPMAHRLRRRFSTNSSRGKEPEAILQVSSAAGADIVATVAAGIGGFFLGGPIGAGLAIAALKVATHEAIEIGGAISDMRYQTS